MYDFLMNLVLGLFAIFLLAIPIVKAIEVNKQLRGQRMGIQLQLYLYTRGANAARAVINREFDAGHIRDLLEAALAGSVPATIVLAELASMTQQAGGNRIESIAWLFIIQRIKSHDKEVDQRRKILVEEISDRLGQISEEEEKQAARMKIDFLEGRARFLNCPLPSKRRKYKEVRDARR